MRKADVPFFIECVARRGPTFTDLAQLALSELESMGGCAEIVCGPISTGGFGNSVANLLIFNHAIEVLKAAARPMWSQIPYEAGLADLEYGWRQKYPNESYCHPILTEFYDPVFSSGHIARAWFLEGARGWRTSNGASWEHKRIEELGITQGYFLEAWHTMPIQDLRDLIR